MDYLNHTVDLPVERDILILGKVKPHTSQLTNSKGKDCVLLSFTSQLKKKKDEDNDEDQLWKLEQPFNFFLTSEKGEGIYVENRQNQACLAFNLR